MKPGNTYNYKRILHLVLCALSYIGISFALLSCIKDDRSDCPVDIEELLLYVKVVDIETGLDMTASGQTEEVMLALFDSDGRFVASRIFNAPQISGRVPWVMSGFDTDGLQVSAWGDIGSGVERSDPETAGMGSDFIRLYVDQQGYSPSPEDFFFGFDRIPLNSSASGSREVVITQKNSKVNLTVRGLTGDDPGDYYLVMEAPQNGYDFSGRPNHRQSRVRGTGEFNGRGELVSPSPYLMIHSEDPANVGPEDGLVVRLYERTDVGDVEIASARQTDTGGYIGLWSGKTTNILMDLTGGGSLTVKVEVTGWREVFQWSEW